MTIAHLPRRPAGAIPVLGALLLVAVGIALPLASAASSRTVAAASYPLCAASQLAIWLDTHEAGAAAGSLYYDLEFTNLSARACALGGYPGLSEVTRTGAQLGSSAGRNRAVKPLVLILSGTRAKGPFSLTTAATKSNSATAVVQVSEIANFPISRCGQSSAAGLRVFAPNATTSTIVDFPLFGCSKNGVAYLSIEALGPYAAP